MNAKNLSKRLARVADFVIQYGQEPIRLADIGSDHAYLPCNLVLNNKIEYAIAGEVVDGPFQSAMEEVHTLELTDKIDVRKGDGFEVISLEDNINTATICGMGGILIRDIIAKGYHKLAPNHLMVLQANVAEGQLRKWLNQHNYEILNEDIILEHSHYYEIIVAQHRNNDPVAELTDEDLMFGPINLTIKSVEFYDKWLVEYNKYQNIVDSIHNPESEKKNDLIKKMEMIRKVINL